MMIQNPLVPPPAGGPGGAPAPVANAPRAAASETPNPVPASDRSEAPTPEDREGRRGQRLDISV
jgi:hypothetical protein